MEFREISSKDDGTSNNDILSNTIVTETEEISDENKVSKIKDKDTKVSNHVQNDTHNENSVKWPYWKLSKGMQTPSDAHK